MIRILVLFASLALPQSARPALAGHWIWDATTTGALIGRTPATPQGPMEWTITQTEATLTMVRPWNIGPDQTFVYKLDGTESINTISDTVHRDRLSFKDGKVMIDGTAVTAIGGASVSGTEHQTIWITSDGALAVERRVTLDAWRDRAPVVTLHGFRKDKS